MKFINFGLIRVDFSLNKDYKKKRGKELFDPEIRIDSTLREKELAVLLGVRLIKGNMPFYFEVKGVGLFKFNKAPDEKLLKQMANINCPAILFPYIRETIADLTRRAGFSPLHLNPINFIELSKKRDKEKK